MIFLPIVPSPLTRFNKAKNDLAQAEKKIHQLESRNNELSASLHQLKSDLARAVEEKKVMNSMAVFMFLSCNHPISFFRIQEAASERDKLAKQIPELQQQLETELLARTDLENRNMTLKEELAFKQQVDILQCIHLAHL